jgi:hypothetical protein
MHYRLCLLAVGIPERVLFGRRVEPRPEPLRCRRRGLAPVLVEPR